MSHEMVEARRRRLAIKDSRRAVDLILHGAAQELVDESFVEDQREAWLFLGAGVIDEIMDHGLELAGFDENGHAILKHEA